MAYVRETNPEDIGILAKNIRQADVEELEIIGSNPLECLSYGFESSDCCYTVVKDERPIAAFGCTKTTLGDKFGKKTALIWFLGSDEVRSIKGEFIRQSREWLNRIIEPYDCVYNFLDKRNSFYKRWLKWLGFKFLDDFTINNQEMTLIMRSK